MKREINLFAGILLIVFAFYFSSCRKDTETTQNTSIDSISPVNKAIYSCMKTNYFWYKNLPVLSDTSSAFKNLTPAAFLNSLLNKPSDRWSFLITKTDYETTFNKATYFGHGFSSAFDDLEKARVRFVFDSTAMYRAGVRRGWIVEQINGVRISPTIDVTSLLGENKAGVVNHFLFRKPDGTTLEQDFAKEEVKQNMVLAKDTFIIGGKTTGYLSFYAFLGDNTQAELQNAFTYFKTNNITSLILDLRYNGGGTDGLAQYLCSLIDGKDDGKTIINMTFNDKLQSHDTSYSIKQNAYSLSLDKIIYITTDETASASEAVINGLYPYLTTKLVGTATHGKPYGMVGFNITNSNYYLFPITFELTNSNKVGGYYNGLPVDCETADDMAHDFTDPAEGCLKQALYYLKTGNFIPQKSSPFHRPSQRNLLKGKDYLIGAI